jgi:hypothetical protein
MNVSNDHIQNTGTSINTVCSSKPNNVKYFNPLFISTLIVVFLPCIRELVAYSIENFQSHVWHQLRVYYDMMTTVKRKRFVDLINNW